MPANTVTREQYARLVEAYEWFNDRLFDGRLPQCLITLQRHPHARGYYWHGQVHARRGKRSAAEIALNPDAFPGRTDRDVLSTLVHEMVHLWQYEFGEPGRGRYHNEEWADKMDEVGLRPTDTGRPGGRRTGDRMTHYVVRGGRFAVAWGELYREGFRLGWQTSPAPGRSDRNKVRYTCPGCGLNVWGKPDLGDRLLCRP